MYEIVTGDEIAEGARLSRLCETKLCEALRDDVTHLCVVRIRRAIDEEHPIRITRRGDLAATERPGGARNRHRDDPPGKSFVTRESALELAFSGSALPPR